MRFVLSMVLLLVVYRPIQAGHTRPGYVDGCQSADGRYVVTAQSKKQPDGSDGWEFTWKDNKTGQTHTGWLVGVPYGLEHFRVAYTHIFVPPGGETFAVWQPASWAPCNRKPPGVAGQDLLNSPSQELKDYVGFTDRLVIYSKSGQVLARYGMKDILQDHEWIYVNWVQGNLYWLTEYPDVMNKGGEPPRCGYRYYRISPDYSVLEFTVGPNSDAKFKVKDQGADVVNHRRIVRVSLVDGKVLDAALQFEDSAKTPGRPFVGELVKQGEAMKSYVPSIDPARIAGRVDLPASP